MPFPLCVLFSQQTFYNSLFCYITSQNNVLYVNTHEMCYKRKFSFKLLQIFIFISLRPFTLSLRCKMLKVSQTIFIRTTTHARNEADVQKGLNKVTIAGEKSKKFLLSSRVGHYAFLNNWEHEIWSRLCIIFLQFQSLIFETKYSHFILWTFTILTYKGS